MLRPSISIVATEQLVPAISGETYGHMPPCHTADGQCGKLRKICERLIVAVWKSLNACDRISTLEHDFVMIRPDVRGDGSRLPALVPRRLLETDCERFQTR